MDCKDCRSIPYLAHEADMARMERTIRRQWITIIILITMVVLSFIGFYVYESQYEDIAIEQDISQQADGGDNSYDGNIIGGDYYGEAASQDHS